MKKRTIRRSATVSPFGVGAIYDFGDESFVAMDTMQWRNHGVKIRLPRLERALGVDHFLMAPVSASIFARNAWKVPYHRFPQWLFCPSCRQMVHWHSGREQLGEPPQCDKCNKHSKLVPMRFVAACKEGHLFDVPWREWAHSKPENSEPENSKQQNCEERERLEFRTKRRGGGGLDSLEVSCSACGAKRSLKNIAKRDSLREVISSCQNKQPWEWADRPNRVRCTEFPQVLQRGATNLYFPKVQSALDIPDSLVAAKSPLEANIQAHPMYLQLVDCYQATTTPEKDTSVEVLSNLIAKKLACEASNVIRVVKSELNPVQVEPKGSSDKLLTEEWDAFRLAGSEEVLSGNFIAEAADPSEVLGQLSEGHPYLALSSTLEQVVLVKRLREVRALEGFQRIKPGEVTVGPALDATLHWLPGIEVFGEGIFLALNEVHLQKWEFQQKTAIHARLHAMEDRRLNSNLLFLPKYSPRFVLLHTLAHMLIRQLSFECGYASSSLRERVYSRVPQNGENGMAGILIYTADGDSEGSLGGLVREGQPERLFRTLVTALQSARWCSADPICREMEAQGLQGLNRAACHACTLISETSCICANVMLDRAVLIGDDAGLGGYFDEVCQAMDNQQGEIQS